MATNTPLECGICDEAFDEEERCPRILPCYHHFCNDCIEHLIANALKRCPFCREPFEANCAKDVKINFGVLDLVKFISQQVSKHSLPSAPELEESTLHTRKIIDSMKETERNSNCLLMTCQGIQSLIDKSVQDMDELKMTFQQQSDSIRNEILSKFNDILTNNDRNEQELTIRQNKVKYYQKELKEKQEQIENLKKRLRTTKYDFTEDTDIINEVQEANTSIGEWVENLRGFLIDDMTMLETVQKEVQTTTVITERIKDVFLYPENDELIEPVQDLASNTTTPEEPELCCSAVGPTQKIDFNPTAPKEPESASNTTTPEEPELCCSVVGPAQKIDFNPTAPKEPESCWSNVGPVQNTASNPTAPEGPLGWCLERINPITNIATMKIQLPYKREVSVMMLKQMSPSSKHLVVQGMVYAVHQDSTRLSFARISFENRRLHLHSLTETSPPPYVNVIEHSELLRLVRPSSRQTFFNISVGQRVLGRMYIRLNPDSRGAQNFTLLCTGERGPSYLKTKIFEVQAKGTEREVVQGGDYEFNTGKGGKTLVSGLDLRHKIYKRDWVAGTVRGVSYHLFGQFYINLRDRKDTVCHGAFGKVMEGLNILSDAISQCSDENQITVQDCGLVIPYGNDSSQILNYTGRSY